MPDKTNKMRIAAVAALLEHINPGKSAGAPAGETVSSHRPGWKMAGRMERLGIKDSEIPFIRKISS